MTHTFLFARITEAFCQPVSKPITLIKSPQRKKTSVRTDLSTREISSNGLVSVEGKRKLWYTTRCHLWDAPKGIAGFATNPVFITTFRASFLFSPVKS
jgi:hypothetical protein